MLDKRTFARNVLVIPFSVVCLLLIIALFATVSPTYAIISSLWAILLLSGFGVMAALKWLPSTPDEKEIRSEKFCETFETDSRIGQPINTWTNLGFVATGLMVVLIAGHGATPAPSHIADPQSLVPLFYGLVVIFLGPGSMLFHASGKKWAGWFDMMSMVAWVGYSFSYTATRLLMYNSDWPTSIFGISTLGIMAGGIIGGIAIFTSVSGLLIIKAGKERQDDGLGVIKILGGLWIITEVVTMILIWSGHAPGFTRSTSWLVGAVIVYIAAFVCWVPSNGEISIAGIKKQWCKPDSWYQGHGFWHLFAALGALLTYLHYASESPV